VTVGKSCRLDRGLDVELGMRDRAWGRIQIGDQSHLSIGVSLHAFGGSIELGEKAFLGPFTVIYGHGGVKIGRDALIAMHCRIVSSNHTIPAPDITINSQANLLLPVVIGNDVWFGAGVTVLGGVTIGDGCVVGAGSVVTRDLPPNSVAMGVPAKVVRMRS
jgi:acetyltransferase-like isoleucine patch superfamily enzyme